MVRTARIGVFMALATSLLLACGGASDELLAPGANGGGAGASDATSGAGFGGSSSGDTASRSCTRDSECDDHDDCTRDTCTRTGEFSSCEYTPISDAGTCEKGADVPPGFLDPIDATCKSDPNMPSVFPPFVPLKPDDVPSTCKDGFELQQAAKQSVYTLTAKSPQGSRAITLDVDFATYLQPDGMTITGVDANGKEYTLLDTCRLQTWTKADPTGGAQRPPDETIRQFRINVLAGTKQLKVTFGLVVSPMYLRLIGVCDFNVTPFASAMRWAPVP
jgi:hypothetical protein